MKKEKKKVFQIAHEVNQDSDAFCRQLVVCLDVYYLKYRQLSKNFFKSNSGSEYYAKETLF